MKRLLLAVKSIGAIWHTRLIEEAEWIDLQCRSHKETLQLSKGTPKGPPLTQMDDQAATQRHVILASLILEFVPAEEDEIEDSKNDSFLPWINSFPDTDPLLLNKLRLLCNEFRDIFSTELPVSPASIPPFELNVDDTKWKVSRN
jgi:hypothetical protein